MDLIEALARRHAAAFAALERGLEGWFLGALMRLTFAAVLFGYYWTSALTKIGEGVFGVLTLSDGAYVQILPKQMEAAGYDVSALAWFPWTPIVAAGTWAEFVLPVLVVAGLFTRLAALGMIGFILVQSWVDVTAHGADAKTLGALFDRLPGSVIMDQRTLWVVVLAVLVVKGAGRLSADHMLARALLPKG